MMPTRPTCASGWPRSSSLLASVMSWEMGRKSELHFSSIPRAADGGILSLLYCPSQLFPSIWLVDAHPRGCVSFCEPAHHLLLPTLSVSTCFTHPEFEASASFFTTGDSPAISGSSFYWLDDSMGFDPPRTTIIALGVLTTPSFSYNGNPTLILWFPSAVPGRRELEVIYAEQP
jgi:hypothetical protein